ncbi:RNA polymerase sigma factor [Hyalangium versicolor]|uniref:RNA polymerase sigma factor n=1 Tax=Hyalangium versicolor TaxID=2861190 RepID=UPI001CCD7346|nr:sigma-70 family RNA polymerase sigma factor [Hyalangium versicolor]
MTTASPARAVVDSEQQGRIQAVIAGHKGATEALVTELLPRVRNLVRYLIRGDDVDDTAQEALIAILRGLPTWRGEGSFKSWADRVAVRVIFASLRKLRADQRRSAGEPEEELSEMPSEDAAPDDYMLKRDMARLLDQLPDEQRHALVLHYVLGMSVPEITEHLAIPFETVRSRLRMGRTRLRELYEQEPSRAGDRK